VARYQASPRAVSDPRVERAFHEVYANTPKNVTATRKTGAAKADMMAAIALSKAKAGGQ
jgi:hypothetical protein